MVVPVKLEGYEFFNKTLKAPKMILAPMVDQSELAWRALSRKHGADVCFTPMFHARLWTEAPKYRNEVFTTNAEDRPLVVQFCANDPDILLEAAKMVETQCDAVDLNLGCPQGIAKKGKYGSWLQDEWELIADMVSTLHKNLAVPVTVKIRVFTDLEKTIKYAKMIESAGAQMLTVHGRLREQKGQNTGIADWDKIKAVKEAVSIPVIANGNILYHEDIQKCLDYTGCDGVMTAEGSLYNPAIFSNKYNKLPAFTYDMAEEYMDIAKQVDCRTGLIKGHLFKILQPSLRVHTDLRAKLGKSHTFEDYSAIVAELKGRLIKEFNEQGEDDFQGQLDDKGIRKYAHWRCQPYIRPEGPENNAKSKKEKKQEKKQEEEKQQEEKQQEEKQEKKREATEQLDSEKDVKKLKQDDQEQQQQ